VTSLRAGRINSLTNNNKTLSTDALAGEGVPALHRNQREKQNFSGFFARLID
jgi:hypothetical protein